MKDKQTSQLPKKLFPTLILIATLFMSIGYASINSVVISFLGQVTAKEQDGIYIAEAYYSGDINANLQDSRILTAYQTILNSSINLSDSDLNSSITYTIKIYNSSDKNYIFDGVSYDQDFYSNPDIIYTLDGLDIGDDLYSKDEITFNITFQYNDDISLDENKTRLDSYIKFNFKEAVETILIYEGNTYKKLTPLDTGYVTFDEINVVTGTVVRCNQNAVPIYENYLVSASNVTTPTICQVFDTLKESIETADDTINNLLMIDNEFATESIELAATKRINLDINGKTNISTITGSTEEKSIYIVNKGTFTIKDSLNTGLMKTNYYLFNNYGTLTINSGNFQKENANSTVGCIVRTYTGEVNINNAKLESDRTYVIYTLGDQFTEVKIKNSVIKSNGTTGGAISNVNAKSIISIINSTISNTKNSTINAVINNEVAGGSTFICGSTISGGNYDLLVYENGGGSIQYTSNNTFTDGSSNPTVSAPNTNDVVKNNLNVCIDDWYRVKDSDGNNVKYPNGEDVLVGHQLKITSALSSSLVMDNSNSSATVGNRLWTYAPWEQNVSAVDAQRFIILPSNDLSSGYYNLAMYHYNNFYISNYGGSSSNGNQVALINSGNDNKGKFKIEKNGTDKYAFKSYFNSCIDVPAATTEASTYLQMYQCNQTNAQSWTLSRFY